ncbi:hypothetical protein ACFYWP_01535 [Actinacidiphila glaucinigra]|uniref:hypothetical protein n=1 Tax=Actinacidiphila glaucinigra TaxID=235986 RepID=UPI0036737C82
MQTERELYEVEIADTELYITILAAEIKTYSQWDGRESVQVEEIVPRLWVSTDPKFKGEVDLGYVKVRGRKYGIEYMVKRLPDNRGHLDRHGIAMRWQEESSYRGGYRNDRGSQVSYDAKAWGTLREIEHQALDLFEKQHPEWQAESKRRKFEYERQSHLDKAERLRLEIGGLNAAANSWQKRIDELAA